MDRFYELINNPVLNMDNTIRYSLLHQSKPESLSHHVTDVSTLAYILALELIHEAKETIDIGLLLEKALVHDMDEVLTGDIPRTTKYYSEEGLAAMRGVALDAMTVLSSSMSGGSRLLETWKEAKKGKEGLILDLVDMLCVARKTITELRMLGNGYFLQVAYEMGTNLDDLLNELVAKDSVFTEFNPESRKIIRTLISDARRAMTNLICDDNRLVTNGVLRNVFNKDTKPE